MAFCGDNTQAGTVRNTLDPALRKKYLGLLDRADTVAATPYTPYTGARQAGFTADQEAGFQGVRDAAGNFGADLERARGYFDAGAAPLAGTIGSFDEAAFQKYGNPFTQSVVDAATGEIRRSGEINRNQLDSKATFASAFGGDRAGIEKQEQQRNEADVIGRTVAGLMSQNFQQAQNQFNTEQNRGLAARQNDASRLSAAGGQFAGIEGMDQALAFRGANQQLGIGALQQGQAQAGLDTAYQDYLRQQQYPFETTQFQAGIYGGFPTNQFSTQYQTTPGPNPYVQAAGLGIGAAGLIGGGLGWFKRGGRVRSMYKRPRNYARGGRVPMYEHGGAVHGSRSRHNPTQWLDDFFAGGGMVGRGGIGDYDYARGGPVNPRSTLPWYQPPQKIDLSEAYASMPSDMLLDMAESGDPVAQQEFDRRTIGSTIVAGRQRAGMDDIGIGASDYSPVREDVPYTGSNYPMDINPAAPMVVPRPRTQPPQGIAAAGLSPDERLLRTQAADFKNSRYDAMRNSRESGGISPDIIGGEGIDVMQGAGGSDAFSGRAWLPLTALGLGIAASGNTSGMGAIGEGGISALNAFIGQEASAAESEREYAKLLRDIARDEEAARHNKATEDITGSRYAGDDAYRRDRLEIDRAKADAYINRTKVLTARGGGGGGTGQTERIANRLMADAEASGKPISYAEAIRIAGGQRNDDAYRVETLAQNAAKAEVGQYGTPEAYDAALTKYREFYSSALGDEAPDDLGDDPLAEFLD